MTAPGAMSERQLQKLLTEGKFPEVTDKEDVQSDSKSKKGRGKSAHKIEDTTSSLQEASDSKGTKPITGGKGKAKIDVKEKRKMDTCNDDCHDVVTITIKSTYSILGRKIIVIVCFATINYLLRWIDQGRTWSSLKEKLVALYSLKNWSLFAYFFFS